jgi:PAS domain S-box-containing protein
MMQQPSMRTDSTDQRGENHHAERVLRARGRSLRTALSPQSDPVLVLDLSNRIVASTGTWGGVDADSVAKSDFLLFVASDQRERARSVLAEVATSAQRRVFEVQLAPRGPSDGPVFRVDAAPVCEHDEVLGLVLITAEVTDQHVEIEQLRRSERLMVDTQGVAHLGTWEWDPSQPTAHWSEELYRIYGLDPRDHVPSYEDYLTRVHPDDRERVIAATNGVFDEHRPYSHDERVFKPDGSLRYLHTWAQPVFAADGSLDRLIGVCQDITDRKLVEGERDELIEELREAVRVREVFLAVASHELATPLTSLRLNLQLWKRNLDRSPTRPPPELERALVQVDRLC